MGGGNKNKSKKKKTKVQQRFADREARGLDGHTGLRKVTDAERKQGKTQLTQYRQHQQTTIRTNAQNRNIQYKADKNPVKTGMTTQQMVDRDNKVYGNTVPSGSFGISASGKAQAAANRADAKKIADAQAASVARDKAIAEAQAASRERDRQIAEAKAEAERENARIRAEAERKRKAEELRQRRFDVKRLDPEPVNKISFEAPKTSEPQTAFDVKAPSLTAMQVPEKLPTNIFTPVENKKESDLKIDRLTTDPVSFSDSLLGISPAKSEAISTNLNIKSDPKEEEKGSRTGRTIGSRLLGGVDAVFGTDLDNLGGRTTPFGQQLTSSINAFNTANQQLSNLTGQTEGPVNTAKNLAGSLMLGKNVSMEDLARTTEAATRFKEDGVATGFKSLTPQTTESIGDVYNALEGGRLTNPFTGTDVYKQGMTNFGGENFQGAIRQNVNYFTEKYGQLTDDPKQNRKVVTEMVSAKDPRLDSLKALGYQMKENPDLGIQQQVKNALQPDAKQLKGINKDEMGIIGSLGNFILSNQGRDIVTGNLAGTNNALDLASNIARTGADPLSDTYRASQGFLKTIGAGGQPTAGSLIRGVLPQFSRGSARSKLNQQGGSGPYNVPKFNTATPDESVPQAYNFGADQSGVNPETLAELQKNEYNTALDSYGVELQQPPTDVGTQFTPAQTRRFSMDPEYFAQFRQRPRKGTRFSFRQAFNRKYIPPKKFTT